MSSESIRKFKASLPPPLKLSSKRSKASKRRKDGEPDAAHAKVDNRQWASGGKFAFLQARVDAWRQASGVEAVTAFYDNVAAVWIAKWGWDCPIAEDRPPLLENPTDTDVENVMRSSEQCEPAEALRRRRVFAELRERIARWFRHHGNKSLKTQKTDPVAKILADFTQAAFKPPRRLSAFQYYLKTYYETDLKSAVDQEYARVCAEAAQAGKQPPQKIVTSNHIALRTYEAKSATFKKEMEQGAEQEYQERLARHHATASKNEEPSTAEDYHRELEASQHWLTAFAEHVARRVGMNVTILLAGPIGANGGEIGVRCINTGKSNTLVPVVWPDFDQGTFSAVTKSMIKFAHTCFSPEECRARALPGTLEQEAATSGQSAQTAGSDAVTPDPLLHDSTSHVVSEGPTHGPVPRLSSSPSPSTPSTPLRSRSTPPQATLGLSPIASLLSQAATRAAVGHTRARSVSAVPVVSSPLRYSSVPPPSDDEPIAAPSDLFASPDLSAPLAVANAGSDSEGSVRIGSQDTSSSVMPPQSLDTTSPLSPIIQPETAKRGDPLYPLDDHSEDVPRNAGKTLGTLPHGAVNAHAISRGRADTGQPEKLRLDDCSEELKNVVAYLLGDGGWGSRWQELIAAYVDIERCASFKPSGRLPKATEGRPLEVADWMKHARPLIDYHIKDIKAFATSWQRWWRANQPDCRSTCLHHPALCHGLTDAASWRELGVTGPSGLVLFLLSAAWWGAAVTASDVGCQQAWLDAVEDMYHVFQHVRHAMVVSGTANHSDVAVSASKRRASQDLRSSKAKKARRG
ncbi:hypothetical protein FKP32DRAFT_1671815 [Trametes sanguinea]|nr:hypothetical protein FKP32DRAFT_1671815 [Trametes sanguinea]